MNTTTFNSKSMNEFIDGKKGHRNNEHASLMDFMSSPGDIRQCFTGYDTSDTENDEEDFEQEEQHAGEARKILRTWLNAEDEAEKIKLRAKTNALLDDAITQDQTYHLQLFPVVLFVVISIDDVFHSPPLLYNDCIPTYSYL